MRSILLTFIIILSLQAFAQKEYKAIPVSVNTSSYNEYAAIPYKKGIVICSDRQSEIIRFYEDHEGRGFQDVYFAEKLNPGKYTSLKLLHENLRSDLNDGPISFDSSGTIAFVTRNHGLSNGRNTLGLYSSMLVDGNWTLPSPLPFNSEAHSVCHASLSNDGKQLFFASDQAGGNGGFDLYVSKLENGKWSEAINLGVVNTAGNELFPFIHHSGRLYYSSASAGSTLDIYSVDMSSTEAVIERLREPFNTESDDFAFYIDATGSAGYFSSNRAGSDDIYEFRDDFPLLTECDTLNNWSRCFEFYEKGNLPASSGLGYEWDFGDGKKTRGHEVTHCFRKPGKHIIKLNVIDTITGVVSFNEAQYEMNVDEPEGLYFDLEEVCHTNEIYSVETKANGMESDKIRQWFWEAGGLNKGSGSSFTLSFPQPGPYYIKAAARIKNGKKESTKCVCKKVIVNTGGNSGQSLSSFRNILLSNLNSETNRSVRIINKGGYLNILRGNTVAGKLTIEENKITISNSLLQFPDDKDQEELSFVLKSITALMRSSPGLTIRITDISDKAYSFHENQHLPKAVSLMLAEYLEANGVASEQLRTQKSAGNNSLHKPGKENTIVILKELK